MIEEKLRDQVKRRYEELKTEQSDKESLQRDLERVAELLDRKVKTDLAGWIWYGFCTYWTDDWSKLSRTAPSEMQVGPPGGPLKTVRSGGIPVCPCCGRPGFQVEKEKWRTAVEEFDRNHPGYRDFIMSLKEACHGPDVTVADLWDKKQEAK